MLSSCKNSKVIRCIDQKLIFVKCTSRCCIFKVSFGFEVICINPKRLGLYLKMTKNI